MGLTYTTLQNEIVAWTENDATEFSDRLDTIIGLAELRIYRDTDLDRFRKYATTDDMQAGDRFLSKPTDIVIDRYMKVTDDSGNYVNVARKDASFMEEYSPDTTAQAMPRYYSDWDEASFIISPAMDTTRVIQLAYTYRPSGLSSSVATTWLSDNAWDVLLWACLVEASAFMREGPADIDTWEKKYIQARDTLILEELKRNRRDENRHGELR